MTEVTKGIYRHYKGNEYKVIGEALHSETHEPLVIYQALYNSEEFGAQALWVRPKKLFLEIIEVGGKPVPRFAKVEEKL